MRILFLSRWFPYPPNNGSKLRIYNLLRGLAEHHEITLLTFADESDRSMNGTELDDLCSAVHVVPWKPFDPHSRRAYLGLLSLKPRSVVDRFSPEMARSISRVVSRAPYDVIIASQIAMAGYSEAFDGIPAVFEEIEVGVLYEQFARAASRADRLRYGLTWAKHKYYLRRVLSRFQVATVVSEQERRLLLRTVDPHQPVEIIPNGVDVSKYRQVCAEPVPETLIYTGSLTYSANHHAMDWFLREVYPVVQSRVPTVRLSITGNHANLPLPDADNVVRTGFVDDVRPLIASAWISLAPIHVGGGTRLKILEAMALRTPVVATSKGAEGLNLQHNEHALIADTPDAFADGVIRLLTDANLRTRLADNAYQFVCEQYDWSAIMPPFLHLIERVARS